jgi:hypothetical protein
MVIHKAVTVYVKSTGIAFLGSNHIFNKLCAVLIIEKYVSFVNSSEHNMVNSSVASFPCFSGHSIITPTKIIITVGTRQGKRPHVLRPHVLLDPCYNGFRKYWAIGKGGIFLARHLRREKKTRGSAWLILGIASAVAFVLGYIYSATNVGF